jgi:hypothetical protein
LPIDLYARLRSEALASANARLGPRIRNPRFSRDGLNPEVLAILDEQRRYLHNSMERIPSSNLGAASTTTRGLVRTSSAPSCSNPVIFAVNGRTHGVVFTQRLGDNHYRIEGCGFSSVPGDVRLDPEAGSASPGSQMRPIALPLERAGGWSENQIEVRLDPHLAGIWDSAATLVVRLTNGRSVELHGCRFIAVRGEPVALKTIAAPWVDLGARAGTLHAIPQLEYVSPPIHGSEVPRDATQMSALVIRSSSSAFDGGSDAYDFSALSPGWVVESIQIQNYGLSCPGDVTDTAHSGDWSAIFSEHGFTVNWASDACSSFIPPIFQFSMAASQYAVKVWVKGPIETQPFSIDRTQRNQKQN